MKMATSDALLSPSVGRPALRRLSSMTATERDIEEDDHFVVVPDRLFHRRAKTHHGGFGSFATAIETARANNDGEMNGNNDIEQNERQCKRRIYGKSKNGKTAISRTTNGEGNK